MPSLVTGATGFIGGHLVDALLLRGDQVRALVRPTSRAQPLRERGVDVRIGTLLDEATLMAAAAGVDRIYHCAALLGDWGPLEAFEQANVIGVRNILAAATRAKVERFVFLSTSDVYGYPGFPTSESEGFSPRGFAYADTKIEGERLVWNHRRRVGLPICIIRPATVYGPRSQSLVVALVKGLRERSLFLIDEGRHIAGLTYVGNLVDALLLAGEREEGVGQAYNISDGARVTWREFIDALADAVEMPRPTRSRSRGAAYALASLWETYYRLTGRTERPPLTRMAIELMGTDQEFPIGKAQRELGYRPRVSFKEGINYTAVWLRQAGIVDLDAQLWTAQGT